MGKKQRRNHRAEAEPGRSPDPFLGIVENNDMEKARFMMKNRKSLVRRFSCHRDALAQAIHDNHLEMLEILLEGNLNMGDSLFHAITQNDAAAVKMICKKLQTSSKLAMQTVLNAFADDEEFPRYTTPLLFASCHDRLEIVKILYEFGAEFPSIDAMVSRAGDQHYDRALARLHFYQAISSKAYLLAAPDPIDSALKAGKLIRTFEIEQIPSLRKQYSRIHENLDLFLSRLLEKVDSTKEVKLILCHGGSHKHRRGIRKSNGPGNYLEDERISTLPRRIQDAIKLDYKQFLKTPSCQEYIQSRWYRGRTSWQNLSRINFTIWTILVVLFKPIICLLYILFPVKRVQENLKAPYVRFLLHFTSRTWFIFLLLESTITAIVIDGEIQQNYKGFRQIAKYVQYAARPPDYLTMAIYIMIAGMTWREIKELWWLGPREYFRGWFNWVDVCQLLCYWTSIVLNLVAFSTLYKIRLQTNGTAIINGTNGSIGSYESRSFINITNLNLNSNRTQASHLLLDWETYTTLFVSEAAFAIATVLTFLAVLHDAVILSFVGPLLVSFVGMIADIARFLLIFVFVWLSFGIGFTQLYQTYTELEDATCLETDCQIPPFANFWHTMQALFWSLFDPIDPDSLDSIHENMFFTESVGLILYGVYMFTVVIVMLNALIAMMNNTYNRVEENSEVEWKLYRTKLMAQYMTNSPTLPPPFNLIPTVKTLLWIASCTMLKIRNTKSKEDVRNNGNTERKEYKRLIGFVIERYIADLDDTLERDQEHTEMNQQLVTMKESIEVIRSELQESRQEAADARSELQESRQEAADGMREIKELCKTALEFNYSMNNSKDIPKDTPKHSNSNGTPKNSPKHGRGIFGRKR